MKTRQAGSDRWKRIVMMWLGGVLALTQNLTADAGLVTWTGQAGDSNWHNPGNWSPASVPTTADIVLLDQGHAVIWWGDVGFASLTVGGGGVLTLDGGTISGDCTNLGTIAWQSGTLNGQLTVAPGAVLNITGDSSKTLGVALLNLGTTVISGTGNINVNFGSGITNLAGGIFEVQTNGRIGGNGSFDNAGTFHAHSGMPQFLKNFVNTGLVWIQTGTPGGSLTRLVIQGDYVQGVTGILQVELGGVIRDSLACLSVNGTARFDGTLNVTLAEGYRPSGGDHFAVAGYGSFTGAFNATNGLALGNCLDLALNYGAKILALDASDIHPRFVSCAMQSDGRFQFSIFAATGQNYVIEASTNLADWITLTNFTGTNTALQFIDPDTANLDRRFYRARQ
jgi:hypothetical protein